LSCGDLACAASGAAEHETARVDRRDTVRPHAGRLGRDRADDRPQRVRVAEEGRDVAEVNLGMRPIAHGADPDFEKRGELGRIHRWKRERRGGRAGKENAILIQPTV
jgi:hypothetical protein